MRRAAALLTLVCGAWTQAPAPDCPMIASAAVPAAVEPEAGGHPGHVHGAAAGPGAHSSAEPGHGEGHRDSGCMLLMGCGAPALAAPFPPASFFAGPTLSIRAWPAPGHRPGVLRTRDPPPPRLSA